VGDGIVNILSEKNDKSIKAQHCANGSTQRSYMEREEVSSPTVSTESTMLTAIEVAEGRDVATCNISVEEADKDGNRIIMKIHRVLVDLLKKVVPEYEAFEIEEAKGKVLYLQVKKAIYGMLESALLFYKKLSSDLIGYGFNMNPYDPCVANKEINQAQLTVSWHDNLFKVESKSIELLDSERELFHTVVAQGLFLCKRARPDISSAIAFLTTRVQHPTREDWMKLVKLMRYLKGMVHDALTLRADGSGVMKWYTDTSFAVHPDY
jgi:hypothetical protein